MENMKCSLLIYIFFTRPLCQFYERSLEANMSSVPYGSRISSKARSRPPNCSTVQADSCADFHLGNLAISIPGLENERLDKYMDHYFLACAPILPRNPSKDTKFLQKYLVPPISLLDAFSGILEHKPANEICVKIMEFGYALFHGYSDF